MNKQERIEMYSEYLASEGYPMEVEQDGYIAFRFEGFGYLLTIDEDDEFFQIYLPAIWTIESEEERERAVRAALDAAANIKVAKIIVQKDEVWACLELFCSPPEAFKSVFHRSLYALRAAVEHFRDAMAE